ncbi:hypothetical protein Btru_076121 [Bulinus truncatus]|nr:hypothetical protein Btru_076121 [Bulinus truncatus]
MFLGHNNRLPGMAPTKAPPAYIGEPFKLSHLHQGPGPVQHQRVGMQYPTGMTIGLNLPPMQISPPLVHSVMSSQMGSLSNISSASTKKRKYSESPNGTLNHAFMHSMLSIKQEPPDHNIATEVPRHTTPISLLCFRKCLAQPVLHRQSDGE